MAKDVLAEIAKEFGTALMPLRNALLNKASFKIFMKELGWEVDDIHQSFKNLKPSLDTIKSLTDLDELNDNVVQQLSGQIKTFVKAIQDLGDAPQNFFPDHDKNLLFKNAFPKQLLEYLAVQYMRERKEKLAAIFRIIGIIQESTVDPLAHQIEYIKKTINWADISKLLEDPIAVFKKAYNWDNPSFKIEDFRKAIKELEIGRASCRERV